MEFLLFACDLKQPCIHKHVWGPKLQPSILGGLWVLISGVRSPVIWVISIVALLITLLITTHEPPSTGS